MITFLIWAISYPVRADFEVNLNKGIAAYLRKDYTGAAKLLEEALKENPQSATANHVLGLSLLRLDKYDESVPYLEKAKELDPKLKGIHLDLGTAYLKLDEYSLALPEFEEAVRQEPESGLANYDLGYTQYKLGNYEEAITYLDKGSKLDPDLAVPAHFYAGISRYRLRNYEEAKNDFQLVGQFGAGTDTAGAALEYLDIIANLTKRYYGAASTGIQYDTNVALQPNGIPIVSDQSAWREVFFANLGFNPYLTKDTVLGGSYSGYLSFNNGLEEFNVQDHLINLYGRRKTSVGKTPVTLFLDYFYDITFLGGSPADNLFSQSQSVTPKAIFEWNTNTSTEFSYNLTYYDFKNFPERDAFNNNWTVAQLFSVYDGRILFRPGFNFALNSAKDIEGRRNFDYTAPQFFLEAIYYMPFDITTFITTNYFRQDYYNDPFDRVDNQIGVLVVVSKQVYKIFSIDFGYQHISNFSDSTFPGPEPFQYNQDVFSVTFNARF